MTNYLDMTYDKYYLPQLLFRRKQHRRLVNKNSTHYRSSEEGIEAWQTRKLHMDYDYLFVIISDIDLSKEDIEELRRVPCKKIVVMTSKDLGYDHFLYIPQYKGMEHVGEQLGKTFSGKWRFEKYFDFVRWVNSADPVAQHFYIGK